jgi:hypothetical protein
MIAARIAACLLLTLCIRLGAAQALPPPPPPAANLPGTTATWNPGHWSWTGSLWNWSPGRWQYALATPSGSAARWIDGQWQTGAGGTVWVAGHYDGAGEASSASSASAPVETVAYDPSSAAPPPAYAVQAVQPVSVDSPVSSTTVVYAGGYAPVCAPAPVAVSMRCGGPVCLPLPPLPPLPPLFAGGGHHGFGFGFGLPRLPRGFFNPLSLLFHHR